MSAFVTDGSDLPLTGERTVPGLAEENYWFRRHEVVYRRLVGRWAGRDDQPPIHHLVAAGPERKSTRLNFSHLGTSYAAFFLKKKKTRNMAYHTCAPEI